ncbi:MAG: hypothetical protein KBE09_05485 [Candidatus Pacebacteria bacterium]|nr:hypothetical protein [Candidatus Paceibacterota bacterium]
MYLENDSHTLPCIQPRLVDERGKPLLRNKHHRRPRSRSGDNSQLNIVHVDAYDHLAWHQIAQNWWATAFIRQLNYWQEPLTLERDAFAFTCTPSHNIRHTTNTSLRKEMMLAKRQSLYRCMNPGQRTAWLRLFGYEAHPKHVCEQLNDTWLDRDYRVSFSRIR